MNKQFKKDAIALAKYIFNSDSEYRHFVNWLELYCPFTTKKDTQTLRINLSTDKSVLRIAEKYALNPKINHAYACAFRILKQIKG